MRTVVLIDTHPFLGHLTGIVLYLEIKGGKMRAGTIRACTYTAEPSYGRVPKVKLKSTETVSLVLSHIAKRQLYLISKVIWLKGSVQRKLRPLLL